MTRGTRDNQIVGRKTRGGNLYGKNRKRGYSPRRMKKRSSRFPRKKGEGGRYLFPKRQEEGDYRWEGGEGKAFPLPKAVAGEAPLQGKEGIWMEEAKKKKKKRESNLKKALKDRGGGEWNASTRSKKKRGAHQASKKRVI